MTLLRLLLMFFFGFLLFACTRKKKPNPNLADWLERHFPNRFTIVDTRTVDPIRNLSFQVKKSIVAEKSDSLLQIEIKWDKRSEDLDISPAGVEQLVESSKLELSAARELFSVLKKTGFEKVSTGIWLDNAHVLVFENPTPEARKRVLKNLKTAFADWPAAKNYGLFLSFMEPSAYQTDFVDIAPLGHWTRLDRWQSHKTTVFLIAPLGFDFKIPTLEKEWRMNMESERLTQWLDKSRLVAERWAEAHFQKKVIFEPRAEDSPLRGKLGAAFRLPFHFSENEENGGYIVGDFMLDGETFENLKFSKD